MPPEIAALMKDTISVLANYEKWDECGKMYGALMDAKPDTIIVLDDAIVSTEKESLREIS